MNEERGEELSALLDGEAAERGRERALERVLDDARLRERWRRYHLIGDVMRGDRIPGAPLDLAERVRGALADEPTVLAPRRRPNRYTRPAVGLALAASVATVAVLGGRMLDQAPGGPPTAGVTSSPAPAAATVAPAGAGPLRPAVAPAVQDQGGRLRQARLQWSVDRPAVQARLNSYLVNYSEYLGNGMRGMLPYARVVGYDAGSR